MVKPTAGDLADKSEPCVVCDHLRTPVSYDLALDGFICEECYPHVSRAESMIRQCLKCTEPELSQARQINRKRKVTPNH